MKIKAYLKPQCGWSMGIRAIMDTHGLEYEDIDIINCPENYAEMVRKYASMADEVIVLISKPLKKGRYLPNGKEITSADS